MGGFGSGRWRWYYRRETVEESRRLYIKNYRESLRAIEQGRAARVRYLPSWFLGEQPAGNISLTFTGDSESITAWLNYTVANGAGEPTAYHYQAGLTYTLTPWGARRYWWACPICGRRCAVLYQPPGAGRFACRQCHNLTYTSCQESHKNDRFLSGLLAGAGLDMTPAEFSALMGWDRRGRPPKKLQGYFRRQYSRALAEMQERQEREYQAAQARLRELEEQERAAKLAKYSRYLSAAELRERSGLSADELQALHAARLLVPDRDGKYRPKLAGWAGKLATLLHAGWSIAEIRRWAAGRWSTPDPRAWPPDRAEWQADP